MSSVRNELADVLSVHEKKCGVSAYCTLRRQMSCLQNEMTDFSSAKISGLSTYQKCRISSAGGRQMSCLPSEKINQVVGN